MANEPGQRFRDTHREAPGHRIGRGVARLSGCIVNTTRRIRTLCSCNLFKNNVYPGYPQMWKSLCVTAQRIGSHLPVRGVFGVCDRLG